MTLREFFEYLTETPAILIFYFLICPITALLAWWLGKGEGGISPWKYLYGVLVYLICIPGIFSITLNIYLFLFERKSIWEVDIFTQILPIISMLLTLIFIRKNVSFDLIPGFDKLSALMLIIGLILILMWFIDRTHIISITFIPFQYVLIIFVLIVLLINLGLKKLMR